MKIKGKHLEFISLIKRDGSGTETVEESLIELVKEDVFTLACLSITKKTWIASNMNSFVVRLKELPICSHEACLSKATCNNYCKDHCECKKVCEI